MKILKAMAIVALVCYGSSVLAVTNHEIKALEAKNTAALALKNKGKNAEARAVIANVQKEVDHLLEDSSLTNDQINALFDIQTEAIDIDVSLPRTL